MVSLKILSSIHLNLVHILFHVFFMLNCLLTESSSSSVRTLSLLSSLSSPSSSSSSLNISENCFQSLKSYLDYNSNQSTVFSSPESSFHGQFSPILLINNLRLIGSYDECLGINFNSVDQNISFFGVYCRSKLKISNINPLIANESQQISMELCAPSTCSSLDIKSLLSNQNEVIEVETISCHGQSVQVLDASDIIVICILIILGLLTALGTCLSTYFRLCGHKPFRKRAKILIAFSVYENSLKLMDTKVSEKTIRCLFGLRFLALCFIVLGHTYSYHSRISIVDPESVRSGIKKLWFQVFLNFTPWVDTFFLISGLLVCYGGLNSFEKIHTRITDDQSMIQSIGNFVKTISSSIAHRYWRLTPTLGFIICIYIVSGKIGSGPEWSLMTSISDPCKQTWWKNLIYINNFFSSNVCMGHTWYLADDFQFYIFSTIILVFLSSSVPFIGFSITGSAIFASIVATAVITFITHSSATTLAVPIISGAVQTIEEVHLYVWPFFRIGPFLIGILLGYFMLKHGDLVVSKRINLALWFLCLSTVSVITMASYRWANGHPASLFESVVYSSLHRIIWSICWSYMIVSCHYGHCPLVNGILGWSAFIPLGKLTYHAYLIHLLFIYIHISANRSIIYFSHYNMFILFLGYLTISMIFSYVSAILFELPFANLKNIFWPEKPKDCEPTNGHLSASQSTCHSNHYQSETIDDRVVNLFPAKNVTQNNNVSSILVY